MKSTRMRMFVQVALAGVFTATASANIIANGGFEANPAGTQVTGADFIDTSTLASWRAFAVGGAGATMTVTGAAARSGAVGMELSYDVAGADSAIDKEGFWESIPTQPRIYKFTVDARDAGPFGGTPFLLYHATFPTHAGDRVHTTDPFAQWETTGFTVVSDGSGQIGARLAMGGAGRSAHLDNVTVVDVTNADRMINGGFENSDTRAIDWRFVNVAGATGSATISNDAASGSNALLLERTNAVGISQFDVDDPNLRIAALPGETLDVRFTSKKVSGDSNTRILLSVAMFDAAGTFLGNIFSDTFDPVVGAYNTFGTTVTLSHPSVAYMTTVFNIRDAANPGIPVTGAYLLDDVQVIPEPATLALLVAGAALVCSRRRRRVVRD